MTRRRPSSHRSAWRRSLVRLAGVVSPARLGRGAVGAAVIVSVLVNTCHLAIADALDDGAAEGRALAGELRVDPSTLFAITDGEVEVRTGSGDAVPGSSMRVDELFGGASGGDADALRALYGDDEGLAEASAEAAFDLDEDATPTGQAWGVVRDTREAEPLDLAEDTGFYGDLVSINEAVALSDEYAVCEPTLAPGEAVETVLDRTEERTCVRTDAPDVTVTLTQSAEVTYLPPVSVTIAGVPGEATSLRGSLTAGSARSSWTEGEGDNRETRTARLSFSPISCETIAGRPSPPGASVGSCSGELRFSASFSRNCTEEVRSGSEGDPVEVCSSRSITIRWPEAYEVDNAWSPAEAIDGLALLSGGGCGGAFEVVDAAIDTNLGAIDMAHDAADFWPDPPFEHGGTVPATASEVRVAYSPETGCEPIVYEEGPDGPSCAFLEADPTCSFVSTRLAVDPATDPDAAHAVHEDTYACTVTGSVETPTAVAGLTCPSAVRGMGEEFVSHEPEVNTAFADVAGRLTMTQFAQNDTDCTAGGDPTSCTVFDGDRQTCKIAVFGLQNCCESPAPVSLADYMALAGGVFEINQELDILGTNTAVQGAWEYVTSPFAEAWTFAEKSFASGVNSIVGSTVVEPTEVAAKGLATTVGDNLMRNAAQWTYDTFGQAAAEALFQSAVDGVGTGTLNLAGSGQIVFSATLQTIGTVVSVVMWVYTAYQIFKILIEIIWPCTDDELDLAVKRELKSTHYVGTFCATEVFGICLSRKRSYCSYSSPIARIMQQQVRATNGIGWGGAESPDCSGFTIAEFAELDFSDIDLSEWISILADTGRLPGSGDLGMEALTGAGRANLEAAVGDAGYSRLNARERTAGRLEAMGTDTTTINRAARTEIREAAE